MASQYLKLIFKSKRLTLSIWKAIIFRKKGLVYFLAKKSQMISEIYIDQVFQPLAIFFYKKWLKKIRKMIYIDNGAEYHMSKYIKKKFAL